MRGVRFVIFYAYTYLRLFYEWYALLLSVFVNKVAGRSLGELVRKLGERVLPLIIPILSKGLKDPDSGRRQV